MKDLQTLNKDTYKRTRSKKARKRSKMDAAAARVLSRRLQGTKFATYDEYLASPEWEKLKERWLKSPLSRGNLCHAGKCGSTKNLVFHHVNYCRLGNENLSDLLLVCNECHKEIHRLYDMGLKLDEATNYVVKMHR